MSDGRWAVVAGVVAALVTRGAVGRPAGRRPPGPERERDGSASRRRRRRRCEAGQGGDGKALLPAAAFAKIGLKVDDEPETTRWDWFDTCRPTLPSESRQVLGTHGTWKRQGFVVSQTVVAYPDGVAEELVGQVEKAVDCRSYATREGTWSGITTLDLPDLAAADAQYAWCMALQVEAADELSLGDRRSGPGQQPVGAVRGRRRRPRRGWPR